MTDCQYKDCKEKDVINCFKFFTDNGYYESWFCDEHFPMVIEDSKKMYWSEDV